MSKHRKNRYTPIGADGYGFSDVENISGTPGDPQPLRSTPGGAPSPPPGTRTPAVIDAQSGRRLASYTEQALAHAAHAADQEHASRQRDTSAGAYMRHVFQGIV